MGGSFTGDPGGCVKEGSGDGYFSAQGPRWGTWMGARIPGTLKDGGGLIDINNIDNQLDATITAY